MILSLLRITVTTLFALLVISLCLAAWFLFTVEGNRELANIAQYQDSRIAVDLKDGSLLQGVNARSFSWDDERLKVHANGISSDWNALCLLKKTFCANELVIDELEIVTRPALQDKTDRRDSIALPDVKLPIALDVDRLTVKRLLIDYSTSAKPLLIENINLQAHSEGDRISIEKLSARFRNIIASISGRIELRENYPLSLKLEAIFERQIAGEDLSVLADLDGSLASLMVKAESFGAVEATLSGAANVLAPNIPSHAKLQWREAGWPLNDFSTIKASDGLVSLQGDLGDFTARLSTRISGQSIPDSNVSVDGLLNTHRFEAKAIDIETLEGEVLGDAAIDWSDRFAWSSNLHFSGINPQSIAAEFPGELAGNLLAEGKFNANGTWDLQVRPAVVQGRLRGYPLHAHAVASHSGENLWQIDSLQLINENNRLEINGEIADQWDLDGTVDFRQLQSLLPDAGGAVKGEFSVVGKLQSPDVNFQLQAPTLNWQKYALENLTLGGKIREFVTVDSILRLSMDKFAIDEQRFENVTLNADGKRSAHRLQLSAKGPQSTSLAAAIKGELKENLDWHGELLSSTIEVPQHNLSLVKPAGLAWKQAAKVFSVEPHCWQSGQGRLCLTEPLNAADEGRAVVRLSDYGLAQLDGFLPETIHLTGEATVNATLGWGNTLPNGITLDLVAKVLEGKVSVDNPDSGEKLDFAWQNFILSVKADKSSIIASSDIESKELGKANARIAINPSIKPLAFDSGTIALERFDLGFLRTFLPEFQKIGGKISARGKLGGPVRDPVFYGNVFLKDPQIESTGLPLTITGGGIKVTISGKTAKLNGLVESGNGQIRLGGNADWKDISAWNLALTVDGEALVISQKPLVESVIAPALTISIKPRLVEIGGQIKIAAAAINIKEIPQGATSPSPDIVVVDNKSNETSSTGKWQINTDVTIILGNAVRLSGYGLKAQLSGDFRIVQSGDKPLQLLGEISIPEGVYKSYGQDLTIKEGQILLIGPVEQSTLDIRAYREVDQVRAGLHITGDIKTPVLTLYSEPYMTDERILAYIVLGRDIDAGDNNDSNILATAALSMGISNSRGLATDIAEAFGIREFNIEASGRGEDTQVLLSGRLSSRLLVSYGVGVFTSVNTLYLRYDLTKNLYLETAQGIESAVDLFYSFDF